MMPCRQLKMRQRRQDAALLDIAMLIEENTVLMPPFRSLILQTDRLALLDFSPPRRLQALLVIGRTRFVGEQRFRCQCGAFAVMNRTLSSRS